MKIDKEAVLRTAEIMKFEVEENEIEAIVTQANDMIAIIDSINQFDTSNNHRTNLMCKQVNVFAQYSEEEKFTDALTSFENYKEGYFEIKKVRDDE